MWRILPLLLLVVAGCAQQRAEFAIIASGNLDKDASVRMQYANDRPVLHVTSSSGIGDAEITLKKGHWPRNLHVYLSYGKDKPFTSLECVSAQLEVPRKGKNLVLPLKLHILKPSEVIITLPPSNILKGFTLLYINWIDAFRR